MIKKQLLLLLSMYVVVLTGDYTYQIYQKIHPFRSSGRQVRFALQRGSFTVFKFSPAASRPQAVILLASGDGGWTAWEDTMARALRRSGYEVMGIDSARYARTDYNLTTLEADFSQISKAALAPFGANPPPLIIGGWSMGAAQTIAVVGGPHPPPGVVGIVLASALSRGRYGLRVSDQLNVVPTGPGTFAVKDFIPNINHLRVVQWHAVEDLIDSREWLKDLTGEHREYDLDNAGHDYNHASRAFQKQFVESVGWILHPEPPHGFAGVQNSSTNPGRLP